MDFSFNYISCVTIPFFNSFDTGLIILSVRQSKTPDKFLSVIAHQHEVVYDTLSGDYEKNIPNYYEPTKVAVEILCSKLQIGASVLDVGCGVGLASSLLCEKGHKVTSIDLSPKMIEYTKIKNPTGKCIAGDFTTYKFSKKFDAIIALAFIHLFPKEMAEKALLKMHRLLKPQGYLYVGTTKSEVSKEGWELKRDSFFPKSIEKRYRKHWTQKELTDSIIKCGFKVENVYLINDLRNKVWMDFLAEK